MPDFSGPIQALELASWLWLIPFLPLLGAFACALYGSGLLGTAVASLRQGFAHDAARRSTPPPGPAVEARNVARVAVGSMALSALASTAYCGVLLARPAEARFFLCHLWQFVRVGQLDVAFDLAFDPLAAVLALLVTILGTLACLHLAASRAPSGDDGQWRLFACLGGFVFFMLVVVLADNLLLLFFAWQGVGLTGWGLVSLSDREAQGGGAGRKAFVIQRVGDVGLVLGVALLFWGLGGGWLRASYQPDLNPRISAVGVTPTDARPPADDPSLRGTAATQGKGFLTVTALPDALVYVDDSRTPVVDGAGLPLRTPFRRHELPGGVHSFRVAPDDRVRMVESQGKRAFVVEGGALTNYAVAHLAMGGEREVALSTIGPTLNFRELRDQLVVSDAKRAHPVRDALVARKAVGDVGLLTLACLLLFFGACAKSAQLPLHLWLPGASGGRPAASVLIQASGMVLAGGYLVARLAFLFSLSPVASAVVAVVGVLTALLGAIACALQYDVRRLLAYNTMSQIGLAFVALGVHAYWAGVFQLTVHAVVKACLIFAAGSLLSAMHTLEPDPPAAHDLRNMGGLAAVMPRTARAYRVACLALTMVPIPLLAGFWSTGQITEQAFTTTAFAGPLAKAVYAVVVVTAALTSFGMWRSYYLAFAGAPRGGRALTSLHDAPLSTTRIFVLLEVLCAVSGVALGLSAQAVGGAREALLEAWLAPVFSTAVARFAEASAGVRYGVVGVGLLLAYAGWAVARSRCGDARPRDWATKEASLAAYRWGETFR
jgi:NADH-quinone oxidoreductase subunit L